MRLRHQFWIVGPALAPEPRLVKFGQTQTTHLHAGQRDVPTPPPPERVRAMLAALSQAAEPRPATERPRPSADDAALRAAEERGYARGKEAGEKLGHQRAMAEVSARLERVHDTLAGSMAAIAALASDVERRLVQPEPLAKPAGAPAASPPQIKPRPAGEALPGPQQKVLDAIAWFESSGIRKPRRNQVVWAAGYRADTGYFGNILADLGKSGLVDKPSAGTLALTAAGRERAVQPPNVLTPQALIEQIRPKLSGPAGKLLAALAAAYPASISRQELAEQTGYRADTGHFGNMIIELAGPEIAVKPNLGTLRLAHWVMLQDAGVEQ